MSKATREDLADRLWKLATAPTIAPSSVYANACREAAIFLRSAATPDVRATDCSYTVVTENEALPTVWSLPAGEMTDGEAIVWCKDIGIANRVARALANQDAPTRPDTVKCRQCNGTGGTELTIAEQTAISDLEMKDALTLAANSARVESLEAALVRFAERAVSLPATARDDMMVHFRLRDCKAALAALQQSPPQGET